MTYVPGFSHDLFFSYAQNDSATWIRALEESLRQQLRERLGLDVGIWRDEKEIRFGQHWPDEIHEAVKTSAAFLAVLSPSYRNSEWCARERKIFLDYCRAASQLKAGSYYRFLKLVKLPWPDNGHLQFYPEFQDISFFETERRSPTGEELEFVPGTEEFRARVREASRAIAALLLEMRRSREAVFIASVTDDCLKARNGLRDELRALGYDVRPDGPIDEGFSDELVRKEIEPAILSVHVLGGAYDPFVEHQIELAVELDKRLVFWFTRDAETSPDSRQQTLMETIRKELETHPSWDLLNSRSPRAVIQVLLGMLRPQSPALPTPKRETAQVYALCDPTTPEDALAARQIQEQIHRSEGMEVHLPVAGSGGGVVRSDVHEKFLRASDGLLLIHKAAPVRWLFQTMPDVIYAERLVQRPPVRSKAFLLSDPSVLQGFSGVPVIQQPEELKLSDLEPFLAPLRGGGR
jgi:hypothetical protein